jgi:hypothetical protein
LLAVDGRKLHLYVAPQRVVRVVFADQWPMQVFVGLLQHRFELHLQWFCGKDCYNTRWKCVPDQATANICVPEGPGDPCTYDADCGLANGNGSVDNACVGSPGSKHCCVNVGNGCKDSSGTAHNSWCCSGTCNNGTGMCQ